MRRKTGMLVFGTATALTVLALAGCGSDGLSASSTCKDFAEASPENQARAISSLSSKFDTPEYATPLGSLQCPVCKVYSEEQIPALIKGLVSEGKVKLTFRNFAIIGPESVPAGAAALEREVKATTQQAEKLGLAGAPSFAIMGPKTRGLELLGTPSSGAALEEAINRAS